MSESPTSQPPNPGFFSAQDPALRIRRVLESDMVIESIQVPREPEKHGILTIHGHLRAPSHEAFPRWLQDLRTLGYTPILRHASDPAPVFSRNGLQPLPDPNPERTDTGGNGSGNSAEDSASGDEDEGVVVHILAGIPPQAKSHPRRNLILFALTVLSTLFVGSLYGGDPSRISSVGDLFLPQNIIQGWPFSVSLLTILVAHEFGHYFAARFHKVAVTLPFFIPLPVGFGTLGAFIQMKEPVPDRRKLFDIGVAGPLAGFVLAIPLLFIGLSTSTVQVPPPNAAALLEGNSILYYFAKIAVFGKPLPNPITGEDVFMNQVTYAAWIGLLVTALNLLPVGQLDGGHTVYALFGRNARYVNITTLIFMGLLAVAGLEPLQEMFPVLENLGFFGWFVWLGLIFLVLGPYHPPALDDVTRLDQRRRWVGYLVIFCFIITFVPTPFRPLQ